MRSTLYWICAILTGVGATLNVASQLQAWFRIDFHTWRALSPVKSFGSLIPSLLLPFIPSVLTIQSLVLIAFTLSVILAAVFWRRIWLGLRHSEWIPSGYRGFPRFIAQAGATCILLGMLSLLLGYLLLPAGRTLAFLLLPLSTLLVPWGFLLSELLGFYRDATAAHPPPGTALTAEKQRPLR